jgi:hypothetical protein
VTPAAAGAASPRPTGHILTSGNGELQQGLSAVPQSHRKTSQRADDEIHVPSGFVAGFLGQRCDVRFKGVKRRLCGLRRMIEQVGNALTRSRNRSADIRLEGTNIPARRFPASH